METRQVKGHPREDPLSIHMDRVRLKVGHLDLEATVKLLRNSRQELDSQDLMAARLNEALYEKCEKASFYQNVYK